MSRFFILAATLTLLAAGCTKQQITLEDVGTLNQTVFANETAAQASTIKL